MPQAVKEKIKKFCPYKNMLEMIFISLKVQPEKEYLFHPTRKWRVDYFFPKHKIAIEYEGMAYFGGKSRHTTISGFTGDAEKYNEMALMGILLLRFNAEMINKGKALAQIERAFKGGNNASS
jgi:hypothetical protein